MQKDKELQFIASKYHCGDMLNKPFFKDMFTLWLKIKKVTGRDPHEWLKHFDTETYKNTGAIGWIDAQNAIEKVAEKYEEKLRALVNKE